jgi:hypothetical protein
MTKYKISRAEYFIDKTGKRWVVYLSVVDGNAYCSIHDSTGLTDDEAKGKYSKKEGWQYGKFRREHYRQVQSQWQQVQILN